MRYYKMNEDQAEKLINVLIEIKDAISMTKTEETKTLSKELRRIKTKLSRDYFTLGLNEPHKKYLKDVLNNRVTSIFKAEL